jgi:eukaryotic-like serine/threonine-protein kinase
LRLRLARFASSAEFSPNGRWIAYHTEESGQSEVFVQPFPGPGPRVQVSTQGGWNPAWNPNGSELFFLAPASGSAGGSTPKQRMMVVAVHEAPALTLGAPRQLFEFTDWKEFLSCDPTRCYDVAPDGQRFFVVQYRKLADAPPTTHINLIVNWLEELKQKVPTGLP